jgi:hypothetical protein
MSYDTLNAKLTAAFNDLRTNQQNCSNSSGGESNICRQIDTNPNIQECIYSKENYSTFSKFDENYRITTHTPDNNCTSESIGFLNSISPTYKNAYKLVQSYAKLGDAFRFQQGKSISTDLYAINLKYSNIQQQRTELDNKLLNLYSTQGSIPDMIYRENDSTIYSNLLWTILATSLVYYVFTKL